MNFRTARIKHESLAVIQLRLYRFEGLPTALHVPTEQSILAVGGWTRGWAQSRVLVRILAKIGVFRPSNFSEHV